MDDWFRRFSHRTAELVGRSGAFILAVTVIVAWAVSGPVFHFTDTWQLVINTGTTIVTFLMVFLIQNTQNRDAHAIHLKLDELIRANKNARNSLLALESMSDTDLKRLQDEFEELRDRVAKARARQGHAGGTAEETKWAGRDSNPLPSRPEATTEDAETSHDGAFDAARDGSRQPDPEAAVLAAIQAAVAADDMALASELIEVRKRTKARAPSPVLELVRDASSDGAKRSRR